MIFNTEDCHLKMIQNFHWNKKEDLGFPKSSFLYATKSIFHVEHVQPSIRLQRSFRRCSRFSRISFWCSFAFFNHHKGPFLFIQVELIDFLYLSSK